MNRWIGIWAIVALAGGVLANTIGDVEKFALAENRALVLDELIAGTDDYYYYHCLYHQHQGELDKVDALMKEWDDRRSNTPAGFAEMRNRQALLRYGGNAKEKEAALQYLQSTLNLRFNHQRDADARRKNLPTALEQKLITRDAYWQEAVARRNLNYAQPFLNEWLMKKKHDRNQRRWLLARLERPDYTGVVELIAEDLKDKQPKPFGSYKVHKLLTLEQLEALAEAVRPVRSENAYVEAYLERLRPTADQDPQMDAKVREAWLERMWAFVETLPPNHNSLKAHVLYGRLAHDRALGVFDQQRFLEYLKLPRNLFYVKREYRSNKQFQRQNAICNLNANYQRQTGMSSVGNDLSLVTDYLEHFQAAGVNADVFAPYLDPKWYRTKQAEFGLTRGLGDARDWEPNLSPEQLRQLRDAVQLELAPQNPTYLAPGDKVELQVEVKNVPELIVKVYRLNSLNYFREKGAELSTAIDLDGLIAGEEKTHTYQDPAIRKVRRTFSLPQLQGRGDFVVEFIGNGRSCRALVRKGAFRVRNEITTAGHQLTVLNEANELVPGARVLLGTTEYVADEKGQVILPFVADGGRRQLIVAKGQAASLVPVELASEEFELDAGFYVEREGLLLLQKAEVAVRPVLRLHGRPVSLELLEDVVLQVQSTDAEGVTATARQTPFVVQDNGESVFEFQVPEGVRALSFSLTAKVKVLSRNEKVDLEASHQMSLNGIDSTAQLVDLHLGKGADGYFIDLRGRNGEPRSGLAVELSFMHRHFSQWRRASLRSDDAGRVQLGQLAEVNHVRAQHGQGQERIWSLPQQRTSSPGLVQGRVGEPLRLAYAGPATAVARENFSLLAETPHGFRQDYFGTLKLEAGYLVVDDLPAGDYWLRMDESEVQVRLTDGDRQGAFAANAHRELELQQRTAPQILKIAAAAKGIRVEVANATPQTRVHLIATRYLPVRDPYADLMRHGRRAPALNWVQRPSSLYVSGRDIGDEYRYVLERRGAAKYPGNMLPRPELLLNPWAVSDTNTDISMAGAGDAFASRRAAGKAGMSADRFGGGSALIAADQAGFPNYDFMAVPSKPLFNLRVGKDGAVTVERQALGDGQHLHVLLVDPEGMTYGQAALAELPLERRELRLVRALAADAHASQQRRTSILPAGDDFVIEDVTTSEFEIYDTLEDAYRLLTTVNESPVLKEFAFLTKWPELKADAKATLYAKYACHELNFFLFRKDKAFFKATISPYLANKKDKTFLDEWLLEEDLTAWLEPVPYASLNVFERILLGQRLGRADAAAKHVNDLYDLLPPELERDNHLFDLAVRSSALDSADEFGVVAVTETAVMDAADFDDNLALMEKPAAAPLMKKLEAKQKRKSSRQLAERNNKPSKEMDKFFANVRDEKGNSVRQLYRMLEQTKEWAENNYYHVPQADQDYGLISVNHFWNDYAGHGDGPFLSASFAHASRNHTEALLALALLDLPFSVDKPESNIDKVALTVKPKAPAIAFHKEILTAEPAADSPILCNQNYFRLDDRYHHINNERRDKFVRKEFVTQVVYGCQTVATNPTSTPRKLDVLTQIPRGAVPVKGTLYTRGQHVNLGAYQTQRLEIYFYFPSPLQASHFPIHVAKDGEVVAQAEPFVLNVVDDPTIIDKTAWSWVSQNGNDADVITWLKTQNPRRADLSRILFRLDNKPFFAELTKFLDGRHIYERNVWSYAVKHRDEPRMREFLAGESNFLDACGLYIDSELVTIDPVARGNYAHLEYRPLVNARAHRLGGDRKILNDRFHAQYHRFLHYMRYRPELSSQDWFDATYYLLLQDRVGDAIAAFANVKREAVMAKMQYDYAKAYLAFYVRDLETAEKIAKTYADYPVPRWQQAFATVANHLAEIKGEGAAVANPEDRTQEMDQLAATAPSIDLSLVDGEVRVAHRNLSAITVNYYLTDVELLFSRNPFVGSGNAQFSYVEPNQSMVQRLGAKAKHTMVAIPKDLRQRNLIVEVVGDGVRRSLPYFANTMAVQVSEAYGQVRVGDSRDKPLSTVYVKAYAKMKDGSIAFYKDGYTDLRGRFDYASLSTGELDNVDKFALLVMHDQHGAVIREAPAPTR